MAGCLGWSLEEAIWLWNNTGFFGFQEEFCYPVECLALTVEEVMHIRQVLVKAELEKYQQYKDVYTALKKGKVGLSLWRLQSLSREAGHTGLPSYTFVSYPVLERKKRYPPNIPLNV